MALQVSGEPAAVEGSGADPEVGVADDLANILVVDDLAEKLLVFGTVLEDLGQNLVFVRSGNEALREVLQREFAVILLDVNMPDIDGFETASLIRRYKKSAHTPIIFITAYADEIQTAKGYSLGAVDYIMSPVNPEVLRSKVKVFVELYRMQRAVRRRADERVALAAAEAARRVAEESDRRSNFLSQASRVLGGSLDVTVGTRQLVELVVPRLASLAVLGLVDENRALGPLLVRHGNAMATTLTAGEFEDLPEAMQQLFERALGGGRAVPVPPVTLQLLRAEGLGLSGRLELRSALAVPLMIGERGLGVLMVAGGVAQDGGAADWSVLEDLGGRAAIAFENASLYRSLQSEIAERRAAQTELQDANQRKDEFLAMLSHELRNPLAPIRNALEVIRRIAPPDPKFAWAGDVMDRQVHHMARLVDELLDVARISQGKIALHKENVDLNAVVAQSVETAQPFIDARRHSLQVKLPEGPVLLQGDFARLSQIVANLLHNAAKYSEDGGSILLQSSMQPGEVVLSIRDQGMGIDAELLPRIFDLFSQGTRSLDRSQGGLGVGLTLVRRLAELHGGRVEAFSAGSGKGAEFRVTLPRIGIVPSKEDDQVTVAQPQAVRGSRVLIVDDNRDAAESVALFLQLEGHEVKSVNDGMQALACVSVFAPQVVVLDIGLPVLSGYEVARRLRELPVTRDALLVALTGYGQKEDQMRAAEAGFDHHFVKPTDPHEIVRLISLWQQKSEAHKSSRSTGARASQNS
jgi:signal transduction histidine kinase/DNA-binding response OmpR family regulator